MKFERLEDFLKEYKDLNLKFSIDEKGTQAMITFSEFEIPVIIKKQKVFSDFYKNTYSMCVTAEIDVSLCRMNLDNFLLGKSLELVTAIEENQLLFGRIVEYL